MPSLKKQAVSFPQTVTLKNSSIRDSSSESDSDLTDTSTNFYRGLKRKINEKLESESPSKIPKINNNDDLRPLNNAFKVTEKNNKPKVSLFLFFFVLIFSIIFSFRSLSEELKMKSLMRIISKNLEKMHLIIR